MTCRDFKDHFSDESAAYQRYRPRYPQELFAELAALAPRRERAWDCATGSGQAAVALAVHFAEVVATDASGDQIAQATPSAGVTYRVARAEASGLPPGSVDLVTVAQALHWLDLEGFTREVRRVLRPGGHLAAWTYRRLQVAPAVDTVLDRLYGPVLGAFWPPERRHVESGYRELALPLPEVTAPTLAMTASWTAAHLLNYLRTWSAAKRCLAATGRDEVTAHAGELIAAWGDPDTVRTVTWPLDVRVWAVGR